MHVALSRQRPVSNDRRASMHRIGFGNLVDTNETLANKASTELYVRGRVLLKIILETFVTARQHSSGVLKGFMPTASSTPSIISPT